MSQKPNYSQLLRDPRWQKRRLEILSRDQFTCCKCCASVNDGIPLNVHHRYYVSGRAPWEYPEWCYQTMCEQCHAVAHTEDVKTWEEFMGLWMPIGGHEVLYQDVITFMRYLALIEGGSGRAMLPEGVRISMLTAALWEWWRREKGEDAMPMCAQQMAFGPMWKAVPEYWEEHKKMLIAGLAPKKGEKDANPNG